MGAKLYSNDYFTFRIMKDVIHHWKIYMKTRNIIHHLNT